MERIDHIEEILEKSGITFLAQMNFGETLKDNLGLILDPKNLYIISVLARFVEQAPTLEKLADMLEKMEKSGALSFFGHVSENFGEGLGMAMDPQVLKLFSHLANILDILSRIEPSAIGMLASAIERGLSETFSLDVIKDPPKLGLVGILKQLSDPDVQKALGIIFLFLKALGRAFSHMGEDIKAMEDMIAKVMPKK
jgi:uncharacterized protein YjgD (DUF1641 family)